MRKGCKRAAAAALCLVLLAAVPVTLWRKQAGELQDQYAAERWQGQNETEYVQVSCMIDEFQNFSKDYEYQRREQLKQAMSGDTDEAFTTAGSGMTTVSVATEEKTVSARAICIYGDFGLFHPVKMLTGSFCSEGEPNSDGVVLDVNLAWKLFGGYELEDMRLSINGVPVQVTGVADFMDGVEADSFGVEPTVWIPMGLFPNEGSAPAVTCYEAVLPNPVKGYGLGKVTELLNIDEDDCDYIENTGRFSAVNSLKNLLKTGVRLMRTSKVRYPYWENAARNAENRCAIYVGLAALLLLYPAGFIVVSGILLFIRTRRAVRAGIEKKRKYWK